MIDTETSVAGRTTVRLDTTLASQPVTVHTFQFGTVPAPHPVATYGVIASSVPAGIAGADVFSFDSSIAIPAGQSVRFDIRFELNIHNSANLQICICPGVAVDDDNQVCWRWTAPAGYLGDWSDSEQQAPWYDHSVDYFITISGDGDVINVSVGDHPGSAKQQRPFIPPHPKAAPMIRGNGPSDGPTG